MTIRSNAMLELQIPPSLEWLRRSNKYIEHLHDYKYDKWAKGTVITKRDDIGFENEFTFIQKTIGF